MGAGNYGEGADYFGKVKIKKRNTMGIKKK